VLAAMSFTDPQLFEIGWRSQGQPRRAVLAEVVAEGLAGGQLRHDLDVELFLDVLSAVPIWSQLVRPGSEFSIASAGATVDLLLAGAAPPGKPVVDMAERGIGAPAHELTRALTTEGEKT
jgi:Tetracyclin repressor-like, C-terminal domain